jgi:hypothetical protein
MLPSNLDLPLNTKNVPPNVTELLPRFGNFWGHRFWVMNFWFTTSELYVMILCVLVSSFGISLHLVRVATPNFTHIRIKFIPFCSSKSWEKFEPFSSGLCMRLSFIAVKTYPCARDCIGFWHLSLIPDVCLWIHDRWCAGVDSLELPRGGWFSCTFVGHPKELWVHRVSRVLGTWAHDHKPTASLWSECEDTLCPTHPTWEEWEVKAQGLNLADTVQKAALEALTTFLWEARWFGS